MGDTSSSAKSLKEYLKKYTSNDDNETKKKKKKRKTKPDVSGVHVVDEDPIWQKPVDFKNDEEEDSPEEDKPQVDEDIEVKRMKRLELLRSKRAVGTISEDGSGWVSVSTVSNGAAREGGRRNDSPSPEPGPRSDGLSGADLSPPRRSHKRSPSVELEKPDASGSRRERGAVRYDTPSPREASDSEDLSPVRRRRRDERTSSSPKAVDSDISPPRRNRHGSFPAKSNADEPKDLSPVRRRRDRSTSHSVHERTSSSPKAMDSDISPPRRTRHGSSNPAISTSDLSPPRKGKGSKPSLPPRRTGLVSAEDIKDEISKVKKETAARFKEMDPSVSGQNAAPVYRDKITGKRMSREEFLNSQKKEPKNEPPKEVKLEWGKGLAQKQEAEARLKEIESEKDKPFARSRDDPDLDSFLKERVRWGDPMAHLVKKKHPEMILRDLGDDEKMKESGFVIPQDIPTHSWIRRGLPPAPNRYGIKPGDTGTVSIAATDMRRSYSTGTMKEELQSKKLTFGLLRTCELRFQMFWGSFCNIFKY